MKHLKKFENYNADIDSGVEEVTLDMAKKWVDREIHFFDECEDVYQAVEDMLYDIEHFIDDRKKTYSEEELKEYMKKVWNESFGVKENFSFGDIPKKEESTFIKLIKTAERDGYLKGPEGSAAYVMDAARKIADKFDKLHPEEKKIFRDTYYGDFLKLIHKK